MDMVSTTIVVFNDWVTFLAKFSWLLDLVSECNLVQYIVMSRITYDDKLGTIILCGNDNYRMVSYGTPLIFNFMPE